VQGPNLTPSEVAKAASNFLKLYYPILTPPIPIEEIVELKRKNNKN